MYLKNLEAIRFKSHVEVNIEDIERTRTDTMALPLAPYQQRVLVMMGATQSLMLLIVFAEIHSDKVLGMVSLLEIWQRMTNN